MYANKQEPICIPELGLRVPFRQRAIGNQQNKDGKTAESNGEENCWRKFAETKMGTEQNT